MTGRASKKTLEKQAERVEDTIEELEDAIEDAAESGDDERWQRLQTSLENQQKILDSIWTKIQEWDSETESENSELSVNDENTTRQLPENPTPEPTPELTPEPTPEATPEATPDTLQVSDQSDADDHQAVATKRRRRVLRLGRKRE